MSGGRGVCSCHDARMSTRVLVTGATGNVGREVVRELRVRGALVRVGERATGKARNGDAGVEHVAFDFHDSSTFAPAADGCNAVFLLRPPAIADVRPTLNALVDAARARGVEHVVFLSVAGAGN